MPSRAQRSARMLETLVVPPLDSLTGQEAHSCAAVSTAVAWRHPAVVYTSRSVEHSAQWCDNAPSLAEAADQIIQIHPVAVVIQPPHQVQMDTLSNQQELYITIGCCSYSAAAGYPAAGARASCSCSCRCSSASAAWASSKSPNTSSCSSSSPAADAAAPTEDALATLAL